MPRFAAERTLLAPVADVWTFIAEPFHLSDWWPGVAGIEVDRRGFAPGARWRVIGPNRPSLLKKPDASGALIVLDVVPMRRFAFQLTGQPSTRSSSSRTPPRTALVRRSPSTRPF